MHDHDMTILHGSEKREDVLWEEHAPERKAEAAEFLRIEIQGLKAREVIFQREVREVLYTAHDGGLVAGSEQGRVEAISVATDEQIHGIRRRMCDRHGGSSCNSPVESDVETVEERGAKQAIQSGANLRDALRIDLADRDAPEAAVPIGVTDTAEKSAQHAFERGGDAASGAGAENQAREFVHASPDQRPDHVFTNELLDVWGEPVEGPEARKDDRLDGDSVPLGGQHEDFAGRAGKQAARRELGDGAVEARIHVAGGAARRHILADAEDPRGAVHFGDVALDQADFKSGHEGILAGLRGLRGFKSRSVVLRKHRHIPPDSPAERS